MAYVVARHQPTASDDEALNGVLANTWLSETFLQLAKDLDVVEAKVPEDVYKSGQPERSPPPPPPATVDSTGQGADSAKQNLASSFVNGFINAGFCQDKLLTPDGDPPPPTPELRSGEQVDLQEPRRRDGQRHRVAGAAPPLGRRQWPHRRRQISLRQRRQDQGRRASRNRYPPPSSLTRARRHERKHPPRMRPRACPPRGGSQR
jgi:hypothetical protein